MSEIRPTSANLGLDLSSSTAQKKEGSLTFALNAQLESFDGNRVNYQNEMGNRECISFPEGYRVVGKKNVVEKGFSLFMLANPFTNQSEIGRVVNDSCIYEKIINADCLNFSIERPIHKIFSKITNCSTEFYWQDPIMRWIDLDNLPFREEEDSISCERIITTDIDCNKLKVQPNFHIPLIEYERVDSGGQLVEGAYEFAIQYSNALGDPYTQYYGISNPLSIFNPFKSTLDFNTTTSKSIALRISNIDESGVYDYINIAVIKTINNISSAELVETKRITKDVMEVIYTGVGKSDIKLTIGDIKERFPVYEKAGDIFEVQDVLGWADITTTERVNYQKIFNKLSLQWATYRLPSVSKGFADPINTALYKGYMRDETYALEGVFLLDNGTVTDKFHIPNRPSTPYDLEPISNGDTEIGERCEISTLQPRWKVYNTASSTGKVADCPDVNNGQPFGAGTITTFCSDGNCTHQGSVSLKLTFDVATPEPLHILIGKIYQYNDGTKAASGYDLFTIPPGVSSDTYYDPNANLPFEVNIPAGVTSYDVPELIFLQGKSNPSNESWICHNCQFPLTNLYIKTLSTSLYKVTFTTSQNIEVTNIYPEGATQHILPKGSEECADECYEGLYQWGDFAYTESTDLYPCEVDVWGELANQPIRHHKFPDSLVSHIHDNKGNIYPMGIRIDMDQLKELIRNSDLSEEQKKKIVGIKITRGSRATNKSIVAKGLVYNVGQYTRFKQTYFYPNYPFNDLRKDPFLNTKQTGNDSGSNYGTALEGFNTDESKKRFTFHSPDTHFYQPELGNRLKLETIEYGESKGHVVEVKDHSRYKFLTKGTYKLALDAAILVGLVSNEIGLTIKIFDGAAAYAAFSAVVSIIDKTTPRINFAYQTNSLGTYDKYLPVPNNGNKVRNTDIVNYLIPGNTSASDIHPVNNFQRESSLYIRTTGTLPFPQDQGGPEDQSRWTLTSEGMCDLWGNIVTKPISSYYASLKKDLLNQYGPIFSYASVDTGFQCMFDPYSLIPQGKKTIFGGDIYINRFGLKRKLPFFIDNKVKGLDDADIFYNDLGNVAYPTYWMSTDYTGDGVDLGRQGGIGRLFGVKINNFDCKDDAKFYQRGKFYLFNYGISYFYTESEVNVDYRQAFNDREGDFFPHVGGDIPDDWLQETKTTINQDNTYVYNKSYSKQNQETLFTAIPPDFQSECFVNFPNKAIYSDQQSDLINYKKNNWLIYRPISTFDFPVNFGKLTSIDGMENRAVLARFEQKSMIYNALLTINTSIPQAAFLGNDSLFKASPPLDFAETDLGFNGCKHKLYIRTEFGGVSIDSDRGQVFLIGGNKATDISSAEFKVDSFFKENLKFKLRDYFPDISIDNSFNGVGITGVYDKRYERLILTKLDYIPAVSNIIYKEGLFYLNNNVVELSNPDYFIDKGFTLSFDFKNKVWVSFHSYRGNYYMGDSNKFYTGINGPTSSLWEHYKDITLYNNFLGEICPYILEYPFSYKLNDEILQSVSDYTRVFRQINLTSIVVTNDVYFNKAIIWNDENCSGLLELSPKPSNARGYLQYPKYNLESKNILFTKSGNFYNYNGFWDVVKDHNEPIFISSVSGIDKDLNVENLNYSRRSFKTYPIRGKDVRIRHILDNTSDYRLISQFIVTLTQTSFK